MVATEDCLDTAPARRRIRSIATYLGACAWGGLVAGLLIGGIGSRLAMFVLRVTSSDTVVGLESDDGFTIGRFSSDTFFLILFAGAVGMVGILLYGLVRVWLPPRVRPLAFGALGALVGGSALVHADGIDFFLLEPRWLAIVMFVALPGLGAAAGSVVMERMLTRSQERARHWGWLVAPLPALVLTGPIGIALVVALVIGFALEPKVPLVRLWQSPAVTWLGRAALAFWAGAGGWALLNDIREIAAL